MEATDEQGGVDDEVKRHADCDKTRKLKILDSHASQLAEHFDSVQIIVTDFCPQTGTGSMEVGRGNYYARYGSVREWMRDEDRRK